MGVNFLREENNKLKKILSNRAMEWNTQKLLLIAEIDYLKKEKENKTKSVSKTLGKEEIRVLMEGLQWK